MGKKMNSFPKSLWIIYGPAELAEKAKLVRSVSPTEWVAVVDTADEVSKQLLRVPMEFVFRPAIISFLFGIRNIGANDMSLDDCAHRFGDSLNMKIPGDPQWRMAENTVITDPEAGIAHFLAKWRELGAASLLTYTRTLQDTFHDCIQTTLQNPQSASSRLDELRKSFNLILQDERARPRVLEYYQQRYPGEAEESILDRILHDHQRDNR